MYKSTFKLSTALAVIAICVFSMICGQSIIQSLNYYNTLSAATSQNSLEQETLEYAADESGADSGARIAKRNAAVKQCADGGKYVYLGGKPIGIAIGAGGLIVIGSNVVPTSEGDVDPLYETGITRGDVITHINGEKAVSFYQLRKAVEGGKKVALKIKRGDSEFESSVVPAEDKNTGVFRVGLMLKEDIGGVGTLTFVTGENKYAALGHHIADPESGLTDSLNVGKIFNVTIDDVVKGEKGKAGGLVATINRLSKPIGEISMNTHIGLYGDYAAEPEGSKIRIAEAGEAKMGHAQVYTTVNGSEPAYYDIDIVKVVSQGEESEKGMVIAVKDKNLLNKAGGIVQGMSGSPIVQDGLLIGAVTHVFISDPTRGYAVHSRFMYDRAESLVSAQQNAAFGLAA